MILRFLKKLFNRLFSLYVIFLTLLCFGSVVVSTLYATSSHSNVEYYIFQLWTLSAFVGLIAYWRHVFGKTKGKLFIPSIIAGMLAALVAIFQGVLLLVDVIEGTSDDVFPLIFIILPIVILFLKSAMILRAHFKKIKTPQKL